MMDYVVVLVVALLCLVISVPLLRGKGVWLIAGVNMMSVEQRAGIDLPGLCLFMGTVMLGIFGTLVALGISMATGIDVLSDVTMVAFWVLVVFTLWRSWWRYTRKAARSDRNGG